MEKNRIRKVDYGKSMRMSYARLEEVLEMPNLLALQKDSYRWFIKEGLKEVFEDISPIRDYNGKFSLEFVDFELNENETKYSIAECKERDVNYAAPLRVKVRLKIEDRAIPEQPIFMGDFPIMTDTGTFIINGAERVIVSQLVRSPGIYYAIEKDKDGKNLLSSTVIPNRGAWLEYETDSANVFSVRVDRTRKVPVTTLIRALDPGLNAEDDIIEKFGSDPKIIATLNKDEKDQSYESALIELYKKIRPGEVPTVESSKSLLHNMFYDSKRYDLAHVGRYKFNKKLALRRRAAGYLLAEDAIDPMTGEVIVYYAEDGNAVSMTEGTKLTQEMCDAIQDTGAEYIWVQLKEDLRIDASEDDKITRVKILTNKVVKIDDFIAKFDFDEVLNRVPVVEKDIMEDTLEKLRKERVYFPMLLQVLEEAGDDAELFLNLAKANLQELVTKHITIDDIWASINYCMHLDYGIGVKDDIDHLGNRRIRCVGELLQNQFRIGLTKMERGIREKMNTQDLDNVTPQTLINIKPVTASIKEFFGSSQLSQFMDQNNPLGELTHKRRLSALGPGGLSRERAGFEVRDVHSSHYGRMCPIETPEGPNIGLINSLANFAKINEYGFIETPYRIIDKSGDEPVVTKEVKYFTADEEEVFNIAQANEMLDEEGHFVESKVTCRAGEENVQLKPEQVDLMDVSPRQLVSVATALIPFLQNDDVTRALMGSNMQRQAVPLLVTDSPIVGTGIETKTAKDSGVVEVAKNSGTVIYVDAEKIVIKTDGGGADEYKLTKFKRSNQSNCINQRPIVNKGQHVEAGDIIADGPSTHNGELALGKNPLIGFMTWEGYNYEDAVLLSERLVMDDVYTSIHIEEHETEARDNVKLGAEEITRDIPNVGEDALRDLDEEGIIHIGAEVQPNDILVGKVTPKGETELTAEERLLRAIFGEKAREVRDTSLRVPHGENGIIVDVKKFTRKNHDELAPGVNELVRVYIAQKRKISVGDKMAGRHGNKGVVSRVLPVEDMPYLPNGRPLDIVLNPLGVPSRMNIGQVLEIHLGLASNVLGWKIATPVFEGANESDIMDSLTMANDYANGTWEDFTAKYKDVLDPEVFDYLDKNKDHREEWRGVPIDHTGKVQLRDGRTGEEFDNATTIGFMHYLKLHHLVDDKIHARSTGPYSLVTQQPLGGKAQFGGQRFGEMEVWALEAYGAAYTLQEILTVKSDDIVGRVKTYEAIVHGENIPEPGIPESFKVLLKELHALALDVEIMSNGEIVELKEDIDDEGGSTIRREKINIEGNEPAEPSADEKREESEEESETVSIESVLSALAADVGDIDDADLDDIDDSDIIIGDDDAEFDAELEAELEKLDKEFDINAGIDADLNIDIDNN